MLLWCHLWDQFYQIYILIGLKKAILPELTECIKYWKRSVDDTISFVKLGTINHIITKLNSFDNNIQFTFEVDKEHYLFKNVLIRRKCNSIVTTIFPKHTHNDIYLNWNAFAPDTWERETLKTLVERAYIVCSTNEFLQKKIRIFRKSFQ